MQTPLLPRDAVSPADDAASQSASSELLKVLLSHRSNKLLVAVTGSNMALLMLQVGTGWREGLSACIVAQQACDTS